ncbi:hypothetical protein TB2_026645 [Malus domestica]|uniref:uncharacterized protein LOC126590980 n=1 Tax=Malus sylvestris TaxID=3752 RepID=UPI0021ABBDDC|nr:uncharacterized protein LOC126590980 [Malus sylvestris]
MAAQEGGDSEDDAILIPETATLVPSTQHCLHSINSAVFIRELRSQGISFQLWPPATTLLTLLDGHRRDPSTGPLGPTLSALDSRQRPHRILELGSGTGIVGIAAAATLGATVTVTDLPHVIPNLLFNVEANASVLAANGGVVHVAALRWGEAADVEKIGREFDLILASDVVYHDHLYEPLLNTLRLLMSGEAEEEGRVFVMAHMRRWKKDSAFFKKARKLFEVEVLHVDPPCLGSRVGVAVYRFTAKKSSRKMLNSVDNANIIA